MSPIFEDKNKDKATEEVINSEELLQSFDSLGQILTQARKEIGRFIFGQENIIEEALITFLS